MHSAGQTSEYGTQTTTKKKKLGHRRVKGDGEVTFKKIETTQLIGSIQLGIQHAVGSLANVPHRDLLMQDFMTVGKLYTEIFGGDVSGFHPVSGIFKSEYILEKLFSFQIRCILVNLGLSKLPHTTIVIFVFVPMLHLHFEPFESFSQSKQTFFLPVFVQSQ